MKNPKVICMTDECINNKDKQCMLDEINLSGINLHLEKVECLEFKHYLNNSNIPDMFSLSKDDLDKYYYLGLIKTYGNKTEAVKKLELIIKHL